MRPARSTIARALRVTAVLAILGGLAWVVAQTDFGALGRALAATSGWPIAVAAAINFAIIGCKAAAWRILLAPDHRVGFGPLVRYTLASCAASVVVPLRGGELVRLWLLRDRHGVPLARGAAVAVAEKLLDVVSMVLVVAPVPLLVDGLPGSLRLWLGALAAVAMVGIGVALGFGRRIAQRLPDGSRVRRFVDGFEVLHHPRRVAPALALLVASWLVDLAMIALVLHALGVALPVGAQLVVLFAVNVAIAIPSTPGQVGALELGAVLGLRLVGVSESASVAFALLYHALQLIPIVLVAVAVNVDLLKRRA